VKPKQRQGKPVSLEHPHMRVMGDLAGKIPFQKMLSKVTNYFIAFQKEKNENVSQKNRK